jgi:hypothetical protein
MTNASLGEIKLKPNSFSHYFGHSGEETPEKPHARGQNGPEIGYLLIHSCEGWVNSFLRRLG